MKTKNRKYIARFIQKLKVCDAKAKIKNPATVGKTTVTGFLLAVRRFGGARRPQGGG
jgi:hypothetical protein